MNKPKRDSEKAPAPAPAKDAVSAAGAVELDETSLDAISGGAIAKYIDKRA